MFSQSRLKVVEGGRRAKKVEKTLLLHIAKLKEKKLEMAKKAETVKATVEDLNSQT